MSSILQPGQSPGIELTTAGIRSRGGAVLALSAVPPVLRPALRAFVFGYASAVGPRLITLVLQRYSRKRKRRWSQEFENNTTLLESALHIIHTGFDVQRFPTFCAVLAGGSTILLQLVKEVVDRLCKSFSGAARLRLARWLATFISAWLGFKLLHSQRGKASKKPGQENGKPASIARPKDSTGRTIDLTLFTVTRALDVLVGELWAQPRSFKKFALSLRRSAPN